MRGVEVLEEMQRAARTARREAADAEAAAGRVHDHANALANERLDTLRQLASLQLPELSATTVSGAMPELANEIQQFERQRQARSQDLADKRAALERTVAERSAQVEGMTKALDQLVAKRDALLLDVKAKLTADPRYPALTSSSNASRLATS